MGWSASIKWKLFTILITRVLGFILQMYLPECYFSSVVLHCIWRTNWIKILLYLHLQPAGMAPRCAVTLCCCLVMIIIQCFSFISGATLPSPQLKVGRRESGLEKQFFWPGAKFSAAFRLGNTKSHNILILIAFKLNCRLRCWKYCVSSDWQQQRIIAGNRLLTRSWVKWI